MARATAFSAASVLAAYSGSVEMRCIYLSPVMSNYGTAGRLRNGFMMFDRCYGR